MPKNGERVIPITISTETNEQLQRLIDNTGMLQSELLRNAVTAALSTLAERDSVTLPMKFSIQNGESKRGK